MAAASGANIMPASIEAAKAGVTTGEWGDALRAEFGEFRAPTGVSPKARQESADLDALRGEVERVSLKLGRRIKFLIGKPGLDGHSNGAEQIAARATRRRGWTSSTTASASRPAEIVERAKAGVHCVGLSILSGSHVALTEEVMTALRAAGLGRVPVIVGGIIPPADAERLKAAGVAAVYTPKDFAINGILAAIVKRGRGAARPGDARHAILRRDAEPRRIRPCTHRAISFRLVEPAHRNLGRPCVADMGRSARFGFAARFGERRRRSDPENNKGRSTIRGLLRFARNDGHAGRASCAQTELRA